MGWQDRLVKAVLKHKLLQDKRSPVAGSQLYTVAQMALESSKCQAMGNIIHQHPCKFWVLLQVKAYWRHLFPFTLQTERLVHLRLWPMSNKQQVPHPLLP